MQFDPILGKLTSGTRIKTTNGLVLHLETGILSLGVESIVMPAYTVTYEINGHGVQPSSVSGVTTLPNPLPELTESGWNFDGWYTDSGFTTKAVAGATISANTTLYAKWVEQSEGTVHEFTANVVMGSDFKGYALGPYITERIPIGTSFKIIIETDCFDTSMIYFSREDSPSYQLYKDNVSSNSEIDCYADFNMIGLTLRVLAANIKQSGEFKFKVIV